MTIAAAKPRLAVPSEPHLDLRVLGQFLVVVETLNMTVAAQRMGMSTPAVSQIVLRLERDLGVTLFERNPHGLRLTPAGVLLRERARKLVAFETQTIHDLGDYKDDLLPKLRIAMPETLAVYLMNAVVSELTPQVRELEVRIGHTANFIRDFLKDEAEIIIANEPLTAIPHLERHKLYRQGLVALVPKSVAPDKRDIRSLAESLPLVRFQHGGRIDQEVEDYLQAQGINLPRRIECGSPAAMAQIVNGAQGWAIAPPLSMAWLRQRMTAVDWLALPPSIHFRDILLICGEDRFLDLPKALAERCRAVLRQEVSGWRGTPLEPCLPSILIERAV